MPEYKLSHVESIQARELDEKAKVRNTQAARLAQEIKKINDQQRAEVEAFIGALNLDKPSAHVPQDANLVWRDVGAGYLVWEEPVPQPEDGEKTISGAEAKAHIEKALAEVST